MRRLLLVLGMALAAGRTWAGMPPLPHLSAASIQARVSPAAKSGVLTYEYRVRNGDARLSVSSVHVDLRCDATRDSSSSEDLLARVRAQRISVLNLSRLGAENVTMAVGTAQPASWDSVVDGDGALDFAAFADGAMLAPGIGARFALESRGLPTLRKIVVRPWIYDELPNMDDPNLELSDPDEYDRAIDAANAEVWSVGPRPPPREFAASAFFAEIIDLRAQAEKQGWLTAGLALVALDEKLDGLRAALDARQSEQAVAAGQDVIAHMEASSCAELDCPAGRFTAEARALIAVNIEYLLTRLR